jgi:type II secretory pathway component HofQ
MMARILLMTLFATPAFAATTTVERTADGRFDITLVDADVHAALLLLADEGDLNLVIPDTVKGTVTLKLHDVTLEDAMGAILAMKGLSAESGGTVTTVTPATPVTPTTPVTPPQK